MQNLLLLALAASLVLAPAALAQEEPACPEGFTMTPEGCSQQAWVDGCPPDHMCAAYGPDDCIDCSGPVDDGGAGTCMDGADANETCRDDVQYLGPPPSGGDAAQPEAAATQDAPAAGAVLGLAVLGAAVAARRRRLA
ncbi:MAG: hypothetical protein QOD77_1133 [Thermoplasmata archaeon]|jgi:MYXO-CTERM domain-containing protein|nr:hypothetical protein [Thermoplasmata archaeon]